MMHDNIYICTTKQIHYVDLVYAWLTGFCAVARPAHLARCPPGLDGVFWISPLTQVNSHAQRCCVFPGHTQSIMTQLAYPEVERALCGYHIACILSLMLK